MEDLTDAQIKTLLKADIYRETGGRDEDDIPDPNSVGSGYSRGPSPSTPSTSRF